MSYGAGNVPYSVNLGYIYNVSYIPHCLEVNHLL